MHFCHEIITKAERLNVLDANEKIDREICQKALEKMYTVREYEVLF